MHQPHFSLCHVRMRLHPQVYEERRRESLKLMADTESRRAQIEEVVSAGLGWI